MYEKQNNPEPVYLAHCEEYDQTHLASIIRDGFERTARGIDFYGKRVLVKPNILFDAPVEKAVTTHPLVVEVVISELIAKGAKVQVGDSPGFQGPRFSGRKCGIRQAAERAGGEWVDFSREKRTVHRSSGRLLGEFTVAQAAVEADLIVNLPKLKTHQLMLYTGAVKNMFGVVPGFSKSAFHVKYPEPKELAEMFLDLYLTVPPVLTVMDGITAMEGPGPGNGYPKNAGLVAFSKDGPALDVVVSLLMGYEPFGVPINRAARSRGLVPKNIADIPVCGPQVPDESLLPHAVQEHLIPGFLRVESRTKQSLLQNILGSRVSRRLGLRGRAKPVFLSAQDGPCVLCAKCKAICASGALEIVSTETGTSQKPGRRQVVLDEKKCIRCYCCHEICPADAIVIEH